MNDTLTQLRSDYAVAHADMIATFKVACLAKRNVTSDQCKAVKAAEARMADIAVKINALGHFVDQQRITSSGFSGAVVQHYDGDMYVVRLPGGRCVCDRHDIHLA